MLELSPAEIIAQADLLDAMQFDESVSDEVFYALVDASPPEVVALREARTH